MIKLIACDCDGTLLNNNSDLDEETIKAINRFQEKGGIFMLATGRNKWEAAAITDQLKDCVLNCDDGLALFDQDGSKLLIHEIGKEKLRMINNFSEHYGFPVLYHAIDATYINYEYDRFREKAMKQIAKKYAGVNAEITFDWIFNNSYFRYGTDFEEILTKDVIEIEPMLIDDEDFELVIDECKKICKGMDIYVGTFHNNLEIVSGESDKGKTILEYCKLKGINNDEVIVIGDSVNDISMFSLFENSYCVKSGQDEALKAAKYIIGSSNELGVAKLIEKINDIQ